MPKRRVTTSIPSLKSIDRADGQFGRQLAQRLREAIMSGVLKAGERLPSTRALAMSLGVARGSLSHGSKSATDTPDDTASLSWRSLRIRLFHRRNVLSGHTPWSSPTAVLGHSGVHRNGSD
ncbi:MAG: GntR family transcriptional regulator [Methylobacterium sp.]|nr:GntR family transcriptional regulator [Methylobacterium sp.]